MANLRTKFGVVIALNSGIFVILLVFMDKNMVWKIDPVQGKTALTL